MKRFSKGKQLRAGHSEPRRLHEENSVPLNGSNKWQSIVVNVAAERYHYYFLDFIYLFAEREGGRKRGREGEREGEKHRSVASPTSPTGCPAHSLGMSPNWELNQWPFCSQARAQPTEPRQPEHCRTAWLMSSRLSLMLLFEEDRFL